MSVPPSIIYAMGLAVLLGLARLTRQLFKSEARYRLIADHSSDLVALHEPCGKLLWVSPSSERILGFTPAEMVGAAPCSHICPKDRLAVLQATTNLPEEGARFTYRAQRKDESTVWVETFATPVRDKNGVVIRVTSISREVTERKETEYLYRFLIRNLPGTSVFVFDHDLAHLVAEGDLANKKLAKGQTLWETFPLDIAETLEPFYKGALQGEPMKVEQTFRTRSYESHFLPVRGVDRQVRAGIAVFLDVTDKQHRTSTLEERTADLERSNRDLEQFANVASHELKAPLRRIASFVDLIAEECHENLSGEAHEYVGHVVEGVESLQAVIDSLLVYSRVSTDRSRMDWADPRAIFAEAERNLERLIKDRGATVTYGSLPREIAVDHILFRQLFENLIGNAIKFNNSGRIPEVHVSAKRQLLEWEFQISDNGPGLDQEYGDKVFAMFQRLHPEVEGTGIGLALCKKIVGIHRGRIWFTANPTGGTIFKLTLPVRGPDRRGLVAANRKPIEDPS